MVYNKQYPKKRQYKKRAPPTRWSTYSSAGSQLAKDVYMLKNLINTEFKVLDVTVNQTIDTSADFFLLNGAQKGDNIDSRDGRSLRVKSLQLDINLFQDASSSASQTRLVLFIDKQANSAVPAFADIFQSNIFTMLTPRNLDNRKRFVILKEWSISQTLGTNNIVRKKYYKKMDMKTIYDDSDAGTIADIATNSLYLMAISTESINSPALKVYSRIRFIDN